MNAKRLITGGTIAGLIAGIALVVISCATSPSIVAPLEIPGAHYVGSDVCFQCHTQITRAFDASPHAHLVLESTNPPGGAGCEACHGPGSKHVETGGAKFIINPGREPEACFRCHPTTRGEFELPQHHPVIEGRMSCVQCHDPHGGDIFKAADTGLAMARLNENCAQCHREQTRPMVFEHPAMREGCTTCHDPHGSVNRMFLKQPDNNLCLRCHGQVQGPGVPPGEFMIGGTPHAALMQMGTCWSAGCHTAVHGSDVDIRLRY
ncbi:MAG TPA: cytochrome c3 family protein [Verrucomicrobiae bacterium]|nr:cytochrome c3 family protein [Verrucomicrobiae bacterium]